MNSWTKINRETAFAYITNQSRLLVYRQLDCPEAGIRVPGGSIESFETPSQAVLRNAQLETGLEGLILREYLGYAVIDLIRFGLNETHRRHFFHLVALGEAPGSWHYPEPHPQVSLCAAKELEFYWVDLPHQVPELTAELDALVGGINLGLKE